MSDLYNRAGFLLTALRTVWDLNWRVVVKVDDPDPTDRLQWGQVAADLPIVTIRVSVPDDTGWGVVEVRRSLDQLDVLVRELYVEPDLAVRISPVVDLGKTPISPSRAVQSLADALRVVRDTLKVYALALADALGTENGMFVVTTAAGPVPLRHGSEVMLIERRVVIVERPDGRGSPDRPTWDFRTGEFRILSDEALTADNGNVSYAVHMLWSPKPRRSVESFLDEV